MAAAAGLFAAVAPLLRWFELGISAEGTEAATFSTSGWGSTQIDSIYPIPDGASAPWDGWVLAGLPDGAAATLLAVIVAVAGLRLAVGAVAGRRTSQAVAVTGFSVVGLVWMVISWLSAQSMVSDAEDLIMGVPGADQAAVDDLFSISPGSGFFVCALAFAIAALCGLGALWSTSSADARPLDDPNARPLVPDGYVPPPADAEQLRPTPLPPPGGWL